MFKAKLLKAVALGLCLSALYTGVAYAQSGGGSSPASSGRTEVVDNALFEKQREIDTYLFKEHYEEIESKGIEVVYTGVADTHVEIGIADYSEDKADYLYELFGKDSIKVVSTDNAQLYATTAVAEPVLATDPNMLAPDVMPSDTVDGDTPVSNGGTEEIYTTMDLPADTPLIAEDGDDLIAAQLAADSVAVDAVADAGTEELNEEELIYHTTVSDVAENGQEVQLVAARDDKASDKEGLSVPATILVIAAGAAVVGGAVIVTSKKKEEN